MYIRFLKRFRKHKQNDIIETTDGAGESFLERKIGEEMVEDYMNDNNLITKKEDDIREERQIKEMDKKWEKEKLEQDLIDIEDELEKQETIEPPKRKRGRPRKSPNNKQINTNTLQTK